VPRWYLTSPDMCHICHMSAREGRVCGIIMGHIRYLRYARYGRQYNLTTASILALVSALELLAAELSEYLSHWLAHHIGQHVETAWRSRGASQSCKEMLSLSVYACVCGHTLAYAGRHGAEYKHSKYVTEGVECREARPTMPGTRLCGQRAPQDAAPRWGMPMTMELQSRSVMRSISAFMPGMRVSQPSRPKRLAAVYLHKQAVCACRGIWREDSAQRGPGGARSSVRREAEAGERYSLQCTEGTRQAGGHAGQQGRPPTRGGRGGGHMGQTNVYVCVTCLLHACNSCICAIELAAHSLVCQERFKHVAPSQTVQGVQLLAQRERFLCMQESTRAHTHQRRVTRGAGEKVVMRSGEVWER
jgi:hypothetical protein